jgi:hypothetical protein
VEDIVIALARAHCRNGDGGTCVVVLVILLLFVGRGEIEVPAATGEEIDRVMELEESKKESWDEYN